jgi:O-ureido-D-serine cyclo-ligase
MSAAIAIVSARAARGLDDDEGLLLAALRDLGARVEVVAWDDEQVPWRAFDLALLRSTWDYTQRLREFLAWAERAAALTRLENPLPLVHWNTDKHYLAQLAQVLPPGMVIPGCFIEPGEDIGAALSACLGREAACAEVVVKPAVGAGSLDVRRHGRSALPAITAHVRQLHDSGRSVQLQPYLAGVEGEGETAIIHLDGVFSHAIRKAPMLDREGAAFPAAPDGTALFAREQITPRIPAEDELDVARQVLAALQSISMAGAQVPWPPLYARVDLIRDGEGRPRLLELELCEPSLFLAHAPPAATRLAALVMARVRALT